MDWGPTLTRTIDLGYEQMLVLESRPHTKIRVIYGGIWLTEEGRPQDVFASGGDEVELKSRGLAVAEGLGYARVQVTEPPLGWQAARATMRRVFHAAVAGFRRLPAWHRAPARSQPAV